jgi:hypothetical protein
VTNNASANHIEINVDNTPDKMSSLFDSRGVIPVLPERPSSSLSTIEPLPRLTCGQMEGPRNGPRRAIIMNKKMNMIGCDDVVEYPKSVSLFCAGEPGQPDQFIFLEFEEELFFMTTMAYVPDISFARKEMSFGSWHDIR